MDKNTKKSNNVSRTDFTKNYKKSVETFSATSSAQKRDSGSFIGKFSPTQSSNSRQKSSTSKTETS